MIGWINTKTLADTGDARAAQGWCPVVVDTNAGARITEWTGLGEPFDPTRDTQLGRGWYGIVPDPTSDHVVWAAAGGVPGQIARLSLDRIRPKPAWLSIISRRLRMLNAPVEGYSPRGIDIDTNGDRLDRVVRQRAHREVRPTAVPRLQRSDRHRPAVRRGWTLYATSGPKLAGVDDHGSADFHYYNWVDQFDTARAGSECPDRDGVDV